MKHLTKVKILAEANMKLAGVPALHNTLDSLLKNEKYEELNIMKQVYETAKGGRVGAEVKVNFAEIRKIINNMIKYYTLKPSPDHFEVNKDRAKIEVLEELLGKLK